MSGWKTKSVSRMQPRNILEPIDLKDWESWLIKNHETASFIWVRIRKAYGKNPGILLSEAVTTTLRFGWIDGRLSTVDKDFYDLRFSPRKPQSTWSKINRERAEKLLLEGSMTPMGLKAVEAAKATGTWQGAISAREAPEVPEDLLEALSADPVLKVNFEAWSNSDKTQWTYWLNQAKQPETRLNRINKILEHARTPHKKKP